MAGLIKLTSSCTAIFKLNFRYSGIILSNNWQAHHLTLDFLVEEISRGKQNPRY